VLQGPQIYLDNMLTERGYSTEKFKSLSCAYHCRPSELQQASYGVCMVQAVRTSDTVLIKRLMDAGLSPSPSNGYGESLMHLVCRRADNRVLRSLLEYGCTVQVSDDYGRTPLHDACWTPEPDFELIKLILDEDVRLLYIADGRGATPLSYICKDNWPLWIDFFDSVKEAYWPPRDITKLGVESPPPLTQQLPHSLPVPDPVNALPSDVAFKVASGHLDLSDSRLGALKLNDDIDLSSTLADCDDDDNSSLDYDDAGFLTVDEIAMTLAKYEDSKFLEQQDQNLAHTLSNFIIANTHLMVEMKS
jgi:hypothetical protein